MTPGATDNLAQLPREVPVSKRRAPPVPLALKDRARQSLARWVATARQRFGPTVTMPTISFDLIGTTAGKAFLKKNHVQLNAVLLVENEREFDEQLIPHELAHLVAYNVFAYAGGHGDPWKDVMRRLGLEPARTHKMDVTNASTQKMYTGFVCKCGPVTLGARHYNALRRGAKVTCKRCKLAIRQAGPVLLAKRNAPAAPAPGAAPPAPLKAPNVPVRPSGSPVRAPAPSIAPSTPGRPPSEAMLRFAESLAKKHGMAVPATALTDFGACKTFLDQWANAPVRPVTPMPDAPAAPGPRTDEPPTERQLAYAKTIAARKRLELPVEALRSKTAMSRWIDANK